MKKKVPGPNIRVPDKDELKSHSRGESLHPRTALANVTQGYQAVQPFRDSGSSATSASYTVQAGMAKRRVSDPPILQPGINTAQDPDITNIKKGGRTAS